MSDINVRAESVDVDQIMRQIRARIREKRGADYTEAELQQLATVKLEQFLDPKGLRSDLVQHFRRKVEESPAPPNYEFEADTVFETHRGPLRTIRNLFRPLLKLFVNIDRITTALHLQSRINSQAEHRLRQVEQREMLAYELLHNMTLEVTRLGIEVHNLRMRVESLSSRVDFDERRAKALEGVVQYRTPVVRQAPAAAGAGQPTLDGTASGEGADGDAGTGARRRRRRRRRRPGGTAADAQGQTWAERPGDSDEGGSDDGEAGGDERGADDTTDDRGPADQ
ncbi:MAG: hypothetical protein ABS36_02630 [Acidobacteria bacterium SCN 69-37]|nr:MAG: hypothetical protein ABS36_02630 [Acidobacteria bacterium SCN 69-37]